MMKINQSGKIALSIILVLLAAARWVFYDTAIERMDTIFLALVISAILILIIPWENIRTFKAAGIEVSLEQSAVKAAITSLGLDRIQDDQLKQQLLKLDEELESIHGGRVLWIDDKPENITGERRLLRALGIQVVSAISSEMAESILETDNDFDLLITDVQREGESYKLNDGIEIHEGVNFVVKLRRAGNDLVKNMPVVFYAAYDWDRLVKFTGPARDLQPEPEISNSAIDFVPKVIRQLSKSRTTPIVYGKAKNPTALGGDKEQVG